MEHSILIEVFQGTNLSEGELNTIGTLFKKIARCCKKYDK